jgi:polyphosphate kinase 2 (PPK2 family)
MWRYSQHLRDIASFEDYLARQFWDRYMEAYEDAIRATASAHAP